MIRNPKKKILIVGSSAKEYALAKKFKSYEEIEEVIVAPGADAIKEFCTCVDIREENVHELLEYAHENAIDLTIALSEKAIKNDIAYVFNANEQMIFAPTAKSANIMLSKSSGKKFLYKLHIPTPKFGTFEKQQFAFDYIKNANFPIIIRTDESQDGKDRLACPTYAMAKMFLDDLYVRDEKKILIEDYIYGHEFTFYVITDGYHAIPLPAVATYKFASDGDGGLLTNGVGCYTPDYKISKDIENHIMKNIISNVLSALQKRESPYLGILGIEFVLKEDGKYMALEFKPFLQDHDTHAILNLIEENLYNLFEACVIGSFADDCEEIKISDNSSVSCVIMSSFNNKQIKGLDLIDEPDDIIPIGIKLNEHKEYYTAAEKALIITKTAKTLSYARDKMYEDIDLITYNGKKYRKDICQT